MAPPAMSEKTTQQPAMEEPIAESSPEPQWTSGQTIVPEQVVEGRAEPSIVAPSTNPAEGDTSAQRTSGGGVMDQGPATVLDVEGDQESSAQHVEQVRPKRRAFSTSFHASNM